MIKTTTVGNYPKLPSEKGQVNIRKTLHRLDKKEITLAELNTAFDEVIARVISEQINAGIDLPTDGQIRWDDIVTPLASKMEGFEIGGLLRWFDNNVYYRKPRATAQVRWRSPMTADGFRYAQSKSAKPIKAVLPAPFSFAALCDDVHYQNLEKYTAELAAALRQEADALVAAGAKHIQFDDPCLPYHPEHADLAIKYLNQVVDGLKAETWACYYFSNLDKVAASLPKLKVNVIAADCVSHPTNLDRLLGLGSQFKCCFGIVDARNIKMENESKLMSQIEKIGKQRADAYVSPSSGLEFLPHRDALDKIRLLAGSVAAFNGGRVNA